VQFPPASVGAAWLDHISVVESLSAFFVITMCLSSGPFDVGYLLYKGIAGSNPVTSPIMEVWLSGLRQNPRLSFVCTLNIVNLSMGTGRLIRVLVGSNPTSLWAKCSVAESSAAWRAFPDQLFVRILVMIKEAGRKVWVICVGSSSLP